jgi:hypothetical protein
MIVDNDFNHYFSHLKSSIDPCEVLSGRPFGGCGFVCRKLPGVVYKPISCVSDRLCGIELIVNHQVVLSMFGVYLPFDDRTVAGQEKYLEILYELQGYIDCCVSPCMILGDFNTRLPQASSLKRHWYIPLKVSLNEVSFYMIFVVTMI